MGTKDELPKYWEVMQHQFDGCLCFDFEAQADTKIKIQTYLSRRKAEMSLFCEPDDIDALVGAQGAFHTVPHIVARCMKQCEVMRIMLASAWLGCSREIFREKIRISMLELEREDFSHEGYDQFIGLMTDASKRLRDEGHSRGKHKWEVEIPMLGAHVPLTLDFAGDEWEMFLWGRVLSVAVNTKQLRRALPWEELLAPPGSAELVPEALQLPSSLLEPMAALRATILELLGDTPGSLADMIKCMRKHKAQLGDYHKSFMLQMAFLESKAEDMLKDQVTSNIKRLGSNEGFVGVLEASSSVLSHLGASWRRRWGHLGAVLERRGAVLEQSWSSLGGALEAS